MRHSKLHHIILVATWCFAVGMLGCGNGNSEEQKTQEDAAKTPASKVETKLQPKSAPKAPAAVTPTEYKITAEVEFQTSLGSFTVGLYGDDAPKTVANFLSYVDKGFYANTIFHRVIAEFMIQGGGFNEQMEKVKTDAPIKLEIIPGLKHEPGVLSMARTSNPNSATAQFFVCVSSPRQLNGGYAAFGKVTKGYEIVEAIGKTKTGAKTTPMGPMRDVPQTPIVIQSAKRI